MLDPVLIAVIVVVLTAIGAAAVFFIGSGSSSKSVSKKAESPLDRHGKSILPKEQSEHIEERPKSSVYSVKEESNEFSGKNNVVSILHDCQGFHSILHVLCIQSQLL